MLTLIEKLEAEMARLEATDPHTSLNADALGQIAAFMQAIAIARQHEAAPRPGYKKCSQCNTEWMGDIDRCPTCQDKAEQPAISPDNLLDIIAYRFIGDGFKRDTAFRLARVAMDGGLPPYTPEQPAPSPDTRELDEARKREAELVEALRDINEQLDCPMRNTTMTSYRRDGSVIISQDIRQRVKALLSQSQPQPATPAGEL